MSYTYYNTSSTWMDTFFKRKTMVTVIQDTHIYIIYTYTLHLNTTRIYYLTIILFCKNEHSQAQRKNKFNIY